MVATSSTMTSLGSEAPSFALPNTSDGKITSLDSFPDAKAYLVAFLCNHCPFVKLIRNHFAAFGNAAMEEGAAVFAISSNDVENYPDDSVPKMAIEARDADYRFPYLFDESQEVAKAYKAACTPDFFLYDSNRRLAYRGQYDDARPGNGCEVTGKDLAKALEAVLTEGLVPEPQLPSIGCNIKWIPGNEPEYFA